MPVTRVYFNVKEQATSYEAVVRTLQPVSYVMGELLDSSDSRHISVAAYNKRVKAYVSLLRNSVDVWEIGNGVNGNWTGRYSKVEAKLTDAHDDVAAAGKRSTLTLYCNIGSGHGPAELDPIAFTDRYVPASLHDGARLRLLSYYEDDCNDIRPSAATWTACFAELNSLYPNAHLGFGEIGIDVGGYFWWYYDEDCLPLGT